MTYVGLWDYLRIRLGLMGRAESRRLLGGFAAALAPQSLLALKGAIIALVAVLLATGYLATLHANGFWRVTDRGLPRSRQIFIEDGSPTYDYTFVPSPGDGVGLAGAEARRREREEHRRVFEAFLSEASRLAAQKVHDRWQAQYGDATYRADLKPAAVQAAMMDYFRDLLAGRLKSPVDWSRGLSPAEIRAYTDAAEGRFRASAWEDLGGSP